MIFRAKPDESRFEKENADYAAEERVNAKGTKTAYNIFYSKKVAELRKNGFNDVHTERGTTARTVADAWKKMSEAEKDVFEKQADMHNNGGGGGEADGVEEDADGGLNEDEREDEHEQHHEYQQPTWTHEDAMAMPPPYPMAEAPHPPPQHVEDGAQAAPSPDPNVPYPPPDWVGGPPPPVIHNPPPGYEGYPYPPPQYDPYSYPPPAFLPGMPPPPGYGPPPPTYQVPPPPYM